MPPAPTLLDHIRDAGRVVGGIGKISDIFAGRGLSCTIHSEGNATACALTLEALATLDRGLLFVNLVDFDMLYGHRNDAVGFARALAELDRWLPELEAALRPDDVGVHHRRPRQRSDDARHRSHARAACRCWRSGPRSNRRASARARRSPTSAQTIAEGLGVAPLAQGESFLAALRDQA